MELIAQTSSRGKVVAANACTLAANITAATGSLTLSHSGVFSEGDLVTIGEEDITLTNISGTAVTNAVRGVGDTSGAVHKTGENIRLAAGTELLSHAFTDEILAGISAGGFNEALFAIEEDGTIKRFKMSNAFLPEVFWPGNGWTVGSGVTLKVLIWFFRAKGIQSTFFAEMQK